MTSEAESNAGPETKACQAHAKLLLSMAVVATLTPGFTAAQAPGVGPSASPNPKRLKGYGTLRG